MGADPLGIGGRAQAEPRRQGEGQGHAERDRFAVEDITQPRRALDGVAEGVAEVQQGAHAAAIGDVGLDRPGLGADALEDGLLAQFAVAGEQFAALLLEPVEHRLMPDQAIFDDFGITGAKLARVQCVEQGDVGQHQPGLMKQADEILLPERVDRGLAPDRAVGLGEQGGRHVDDRQPALEQPGGKPRQVADRAAAECQHRRIATKVALRKRRDQRLEVRPVLGRLAPGDEDGVAGDQGFQFRAVERPDMGLRHHRQRGAAGQFGQAAAAVGEGADDHVIIKQTGFDAENFHLAASSRCRDRAARIRSTTC